MSKKSPQKKTVKPRLKSGVHITASLKREGELPHYSAMRELWLDEAGNLQAEGRCGDTAFVCTKAEIPSLVEFLNKIATAKATAA